MPKSQTPKHEIARTLVLSTGHITRCDALLLDTGDEPVIAYAKTTWDIGGGPAEQGASVTIGYWVNVPTVTRVEFEAMLEAARLAGYTAAVRDLLRLARYLRCQWIMLDQDGPVRGDLPTFSWGPVRGDLPTFSW